MEQSELIAQIDDSTDMLRAQLRELSDAMDRQHRTLVFRFRIFFAVGALCPIIIFVSGIIASH